MAKKATKTVSDPREAYQTIVSTPEWPTEADEEYADRVLRARYYRSVKDRAETYKRELEASAHDDAEAFRETFLTEIDGDQAVIYTARARMVGYVSDYASDAADEWVDDMGSEKPATVEQIAYLCLIHDVREALDGLLGSDVETWFASRKVSA